MQKRNTREEILYHSITLFSQYGFEAVSMRDIASAVGIKGGSIYNHFESKRDIMDHILLLFSERLTGYWPNLDALKRRASTESAADVLGAFNYVYPEEEYPLMLSLFRILFMEQYRDESMHRFLVENQIQEQTGRIMEIVEHLIGLGKIPPGNYYLWVALWTNSLLFNAMEASHETVLHQYSPEFSSIGHNFIQLIVNGIEPKIPE